MPVLRASSADRLGRAKAGPAREGSARGARLARALDLPREVVTSWWRDDGLRRGAALSYYTVFSLAPVLILSVAVGGLAFGAEAASGRIVQQLRGLMGPDGARLVQTLIEHASLQPDAGLAATLFGVAAVLFGASGAFGELQRALNEIWRVEAPVGRSWARLVRQRLASFAMVVVIGFLLLVSLVVSAALSALGDLLADVGPLAPVLKIGQAVIAYAVVAVLFAAIFRVLPDRHVPWRDVWPGAALAALLFGFGKFAIGFYVGNTAVASVYGAASSLVVLMLWIFYSAQVVFLGAELVRALGRRRAVAL